MAHQILFSLPVHERPDILAGQIDNIRYFCPNAVICLHLYQVVTEGLEGFL